jgi:xylan 1,4-beta-xylosidase
MMITKHILVFNSEPPDGKSLYDGHRAIWMYRFNPIELKTSGEKHLLINGGTDITKEPIWIEGPHIYKVNGYYYLMAAEGGTEINRSEVIFRSGNIAGPYKSYENNPVLTQRHLDISRKFPVTCTGHADMAQIKDNSWWAVFFGCKPYDSNYFNTGRETFLTPVKWTDDWPVINPDLDTVQYI